MSCSYRIGGVQSPLLNDVFFYIEDNSADLRDPVKIERILQEKAIVFRDDKDLYLVDNVGTSKDIESINETARRFFGVAGDLVKQTRVGPDVKIEVDDNILRLLSPTSEVQNQSANNNTVERVEEDDDVVGEDPLISEVFARKQKVDNLTQKIVTNLQRQIDRLQRLEQTDPVKKRADELKLLKRKLRAVKQGHETVENFYDYVDYVYNLTLRADSYMNKIEDEYAVSYKTMPNEDRASILRNISELKQTLDAFYTEERDLSVINELQNKLIDYRDNSGVRDEMLDKVIISIANMKTLNDRYLEIAIPIQADLLLEYAPLEVNKTINATLERLQKAYDEGNYNIPFQGLRKRDPRAIKIYKDTGLLKGRAERRKQLLALNIAQLKEQLVGREAIIRELRESHQDASYFSMYSDPLVYSSELNIQLFGNVIKAELMDAHQKTIDSKYDLEPAFKKFRAWKGVSEDRPDKMYEDIVEVVNVPRKQEDGSIRMVPVLSFVQPYNMNKFQDAKSAAFKSFREQFSYPEDPADLDDFFRSKEGRLYNAAVADWYKENTDELKGARDVIDQMIRDRDAISYTRNQAFQDGNEQLGKELSYQYHALDLEINKLMRKGKDGKFQIVGKLTKPKDSLYANSKFTSMPKEAKEYHQFLLNMYKEHQRKLGLGHMIQNPWDEFSYILPSVRKSAVEQVLEGDIKNSAINLLSDSIMLQETDTEFGELIESSGERMKFVPRYFTNVVEEALVSRDATNSVIKFLDMANRYEAKAKMLGVVNVMHDAIAARETKTMMESGNYLLDRTAQKLGYNLERKTKGKDSKTFKQLESFIDNVIYGETIKGNARQTILGKISTSKLIGQASALTALARLSGNVLQATNQLVIDSTMNASEGWANQFYSRKDLARARYKVLASISTEGLSPKFNKVTKLNKMMEMFDVLQEGSMTFDQSTGTAARKAVDFGTSFALQRGAEWTNTAEKMIALALSMEGKLLDKNGKVVTNKDGKPANLWDVMQINKRGRLVVDPRVANFGKRQQAAFAAKLNGLVKRTNQLKGQFDKVLLERQNSTRLVMVFRKFLNPAYRKRFGHRAGGYHVDVELQDITEGYYTTMARALGASAGMIGKGQLKNALQTLAGRSGEQGRVERANIARFMHEQIYLMLLSMVTSVLGGLMDDDDEYDNYASHFAIYQAYRLRTELNAFRNVNELARLIENPTAASQLIRDAWQLGEATGDLMGYGLGVVPEEDVYYQRRAGKFQKGDYKWTKEFLDIAPMAAGLFKSVDPEEASRYYKINE